MLCCNIFTHTHACMPAHLSSQSTVSSKKASNMAKSNDICFTKVCLLSHIRQDNQSLLEHV